jgi:hypothetical protein
MLIRGTTLFVAGFGGLLAICASPAGAGISVIDQSRTVSTIGSDTMDQTDTATPFAPFNDTLDKTGTFTNLAGQTANLHATASQNSTIDLSGQTLHVSVSGEVSFSTGGAGGLIATGPAGTSSYSVTFQITSPATYKVVEQTDQQTLPPHDLFYITSDGARLLQGSTDLIPFPFANQHSASPVTFSGTLTPGTYMFTGFATTGDDVVHSGGVTSTSFSADLTVTTGTSAVPAPPAFWMAVLTIGGFAAPVCWVRRFQSLRSHQAPF